ncbi:MAG TPA: hypothetical protein VHK22_03405 [Gaiellaceae bacterium]|jgi:hypothetical protein|nr:hypothetical protein [Gaiellaceae bacterium]
MTDSTLLFANAKDGGTEVVVNFGVHAGREATQAEIDRLARALLVEVEEFAVVSENRYSFDREVEAAVHQVRIELPSGREHELLTGKVEAWAKDCIAERGLLA